MGLNSRVKPEGNLIGSYLAGQNGAPDSPLIALTDAAGNAYKVTDNGDGTCTLNVASASSTADTSTTGSLAATGSVTLALTGQSASTVQIMPTSILGTLVFEGSDDGGTTYFPLAVWPVGTTASANLITSVVNLAASALYETNVAALSHVRVRMSAYTSGSVAVVIRAGLHSSAVVLDGPLPGGSSYVGQVGPVSPGTAITAASGNVAAASAVATLAGVASKTTYITGFEVTAAGSTTALPVLLAVTGTVTGTLTYIFTFPAGALIAAQPLSVQFPQPIPASAANTAILVTLPSGGTGNTNAAVVAHGFQL
jgi:hypothetical protein